MKKLLSVLLTLAALSAALCVPAAAGEAKDAAKEAPAEKAPAFVRVWGKASPWDGNGVFLKNGDKDDPMNEVVVHVGEAPVVDAATGLPLDLESVKEGDTLYAWVSPAATMSLPPQVSALVIVGNVPADAAAPEYYEIAGEAVSPAPGGGGAASFPLTGGGTLEVTGGTEYTPWLTRQIVRMEDLIPGARVLVWKDADGQAEKVLVFPYSYKGYASWAEDGAVLFNGEALAVRGRLSGPGLMPVRTVAEAAEYEVRWDRDLGAVVSLDGETVLSAKPGSDVIRTAQGESGINGSCVMENGVTYLPAEDLCYWLNLYLSWG